METLSESEYVLNQMKTKFNDFELDYYKFNYKIYELSKDSNNKFPINFNELYKFLDYSRKDNAKRLLINKFICW